jgi:predicted Zn-dependent peptidase
VLPNGLKIVLEEIDYVRSISFGIYVKNGSRNESNLTNGISHFIEHMLFKGTQNRSAKEIADEMDAVGGQLNAYTSKDYTCYYTRTLDTHIDIALDVMSDMLLNPLFDDKDIKKECNVILEEIDMYEDTPEELVNDLLQEAIWKGMPLGHPILGTEQTIGNFDSSVFKEYYSKNYTTDNTVIAVAGHFKIDSMIDQIEKYFGSWKPVEQYNNAPSKSIYTPSIIYKEKEIEQLHMCIGFPGLPNASEDIFVLNVFNTIFGDGMSSRLFQKIREDKGLVYTIYSDTYNYVDDGLFTIYAGMAPEQAQKVIKIIKKEINSIKADHCLERDIIKAKEQIKSNYIIGLESTNNRMAALGRSQLLLDYVQTPEEIISQIDKIHIDEVLNMANQVLDLSKLSLCTVGKTSNSKLLDLL